MEDLRMKRRILFVFSLVVALACSPKNATTLHDQTESPKAEAVIHDDYLAAYKGHLYIIQYDRVGRKYILVNGETVYVVAKPNQ
jgi:hypothetical protein